MKNEFVATYGIVAISAVSGFGASTLNVAQLPSIFSTLKMVEVVVTVGSLLVGIAQAVP